LEEDNRGNYRIFTTIVVGIFSEAIIGTSWNMREIGGILAVAVMGTFILWSIRHKKEKQYIILLTSTHFPTALNQCLNKI
jgi:uncharacterized membrane protein